MSVLSCQITTDAAKVMLKMGEMQIFGSFLTMFKLCPVCRISSSIASETLKCFEEAICSKDHARGPEVLAAWSTQEQNKSAS